MVPEAPLERSEGGLVAKGEGWYVVNAREARWQENDEYGSWTRLGEGEGDAKFQQVGINIGVVWPGKPSSMYHREDNQEDFLVLAGECILIVEGEERPLKQWDFVHCPAWVDHVFAAKYGASVEEETPDPQEAYKNVSPPHDTPYQEGWLP
jgi:mannose-6-phosphate isomerase-like protein (cupin superfamily)